MRKLKHPFPTPKYYIEAHSGSSVVVGCSGNTAIGGNADAIDELEAELLRNFRALSVRGRVEILQTIYDLCEKTEKAPADKGRGGVTG